ncbi:MAG: DUF1064 domain-containing protein [Planctomycetota bacterium]
MARAASRSRDKYGVSPKAERTWRFKTYGSKAEMLYAQYLADYAASVSLEYYVREQPVFELGLPENRYVADFLIYHGGSVHAIDVKGHETAKFKRDKKLWARYGPVIDGNRVNLLVVVRRGSTFVTKEIVPGPEPEAGGTDANG